MDDSIRQVFPSLKRRINGKTGVFLDGPAGTQMPDKVIRTISNYYRRSNANTHGLFRTSIETDQLMDETRELVSVFLGASGGHNISFGQNMTSLNYSLSQGIGRILNPGDEILITQLDHEANRGPWLSLQERGVIVREIQLLESGILDYDDFENKVNERTRLVCMGWASNITGTINDLKFARKLTYKVGAWLLVDAVHYAPHFRMNVEDLGCDFLLCSAYKFYGPHVGILYCKTGLLDRIPTDRLRTTDQHAPFSIETGTLNHAAIAGVKGAIEFIADFGEGKSIHQKLTSAFQVISKHERAIALTLFDGIKSIKGFNIIGPGFEKVERAPTLAIVHDYLTAQEICRALAAKGIYAWDGHFYAIRATEVLGLLERGGVTRMGISIYSNNSDISHTLNTLRQL